jgi:hypothetical protein
MVRAATRAASSRCLRISTAPCFCSFQEWRRQARWKMLTAYNKGDFGIARSLYAELAVQGDRTAQFKLGEIYDEGKGVAKDSYEAVRW